MERCTRCCLHSSIRAVNLVVIICGAGMIVYSLWLLKMWQDGVSELSTISSLPRPWFIYTCLGVGIAVCLSTLVGHMVANCINNYSLCIYIVTICSLVFLEVAVLVAILFNMDWERQLMEYIDEHHEKFESFVIFHLTMCRLVVITVLVLQMNVAVLAIILWAIGTEPTIQVSHSDTHYDFNHSFLLRTSTPILHNLRHICRQCQALSRGNPRQSLLSYVKDFLTVRVFGRISNT
ncbi:tetraspanin-19-like [Juglans microcarpa x Juglans regia]|uniref:tetraspanin-19-like n=1 Tax=Juglans microcarpa x Juglans regia TaxID=2249226 RepID=UPI001B7E41C7|nr:tetraspanin-19-like [Juglans microcarpa x Juglans regia]